MSRCRYFAAVVIAAWMITSVGLVSADDARLSQLDAVARRAITTLPPEWQIVSSDVIDQAQAKAIGERLGAEVTALSNAIFTVMGRRIQVNTIVTADEANARQMYAKLLEFKHGDEWACRRVGDVIIVEFVCAYENLVQRGVYDLGFALRPKSMRYRVTGRVAPVSRCNDYMQWNATYNALMAAANDPDDSAAGDKLAKLIAVFKFSDRLALRCSDDIDYAFRPAAISHTQRPGGNVTEYLFQDLPRQWDIPYVEMTATITTRPGGHPASQTNHSSEWLAATAFWPVDDPDIKQRAATLTADAETDAAAVDALLRWFRPNANIRFAGDVTGSRYGVKKVFEQGYGHCWDFSDCFITLCRARGIPARQVLGWVFGSEGHVWAEVLVGGEWQQVDPTGGGLIDCGMYHIGYATSNDGHMPLLYLAEPKIKLLNP